MAFLALLAIVCWLILGCAHLPVSRDEGPGGVIVGYDATGCFFDQAGRDLWISRHVPASYFTAAPAGSPGPWHITNLQWHAGRQIELTNANATK